MPRHVLTLNDLGEEGSWLLVQQARGIPDAKSRTDFMTERTAVLLFAQDSFAERLCVSAAVRQMGGSIVFQGATGGWKSEVERYQRQMLAVIDYFVDCMYVYGIPGLATTVDRDLVQFPIINAGSPDAHPAHVLADVACMLRYTRDDLKKARVGWLGCTNGTLFSLIEALRYFYDRGIDINDGNWGLACMHEDSLFRVLAPKMNIAHFPIEEIGSNAVRILLNQIRQSNDPEAGEYVPESKVLPCRMEFRDQ